MSQISAVLRRVEGGYTHWCPACEKMHVIYVDRLGAPSWSFDGDVERPTFAPSVRHRWGWRMENCCHYFVRAGEIQFCGDCTHDLAGQTVPLPDLEAVRAAREGQS